MVLPTLVMPAPLAAVQVQAVDDLRFAAFRYLITDLLPIDSTVSRQHCVELVDDAEFERPSASAGHDPTPALLDRITRLGPGIVARSACDLPSPVVGSSNPAVIVARPVVYSVGRPVRTGAGARIPVSYYVHGTNGGGWLCAAVRTGGAWRVTDCRPTWIS